MTADSKPSLRERKKAALRDTIVRAAIDLFTEHGFDAVSVDQIVDQSMCSRSTFNRYFGAKEDVVFPAVAEVTGGMKAGLDAADRSEDRWVSARRTCERQLEAFFSGLDEELRGPCVQLWVKEPALWRRYLELEYEWVRILTDYFAPEDASDPTAQLRAHVRAAAVVGAQRSVMLMAAESPGEVHDLHDSAFEYLESGIAD